MSLVAEVVRTTAISVVVLAVLIAVIIGPSAFGHALRTWKPRLRAVLPYLAVMTAILLVRAITQEQAEQLTWLLDWNLTGWIFSLEGNAIAHVQALATPELTAYFGFMYLYGYVILIAFPAIAYFCLPSMGHLRELLTAYIINDTVGITFYVLFIAYGPRNLGVDFVDQLLYDVHPEAAFITGTVNIPINVFPSLHTSMAATVMFMAWRTRQVYPVWAAIAAIYAISVIISTMYLGIHWATDVAAGIALAAIAVYIGVTIEQGHRPNLSIPTRWRSRLE